MALVNTSGKTPCSIFTKRSQSLVVTARLRLRNAWPSWFGAACSILRTRGPVLYIGKNSTAFLPAYERGSKNSVKKRRSSLRKEKKGACGRSWESRVLQRDSQAAVDAFCASTAASASTASCSDHAIDEAHRV